MFTVVRSSKEEPDYAPAASPRVRRSHSSWPPERLMPTAPRVPRPAVGRVRTASSPHPPDSSWRLIKGVSHAGSSRTPLRPASRTRTIWQYWPVLALSGLLPPSPAPPGSGCPQLHRPAATGSAAKVSHLHSNLSASRRTQDLRHTAATVLLILQVHERAAMGVMGWASSSMATRYQHMTDLIRADIATRVGRLIWEPAEPAAAGPGSDPAGSGGARRRPPDGQLRPFKRKGRSPRGSALAFVLVKLAEDTRFELVRGCPQHAFQACALGL